MSVSRRTFLAGGTAAGALLIGSGGRALAGPLGGTAAQVSRGSRLFPGTRLAHADMHNHTLYSDGDGDPAKAFASMRDAGLDIAALTDHATVSKAFPAQASELSCAAGGCGVIGIDETRWQDSKKLADATNRDDSFTAIRGFEWSSPTLGHVNVWFGETWIDPASTGGTTTGDGLAQFLHDELPGLGPVVSGSLDQAVRALPTSGAGMRLFYDWLSSEPSRALLGGGRDSIAGFNHPGREPGRFGSFAFDERLRQRIVSLEVFNRGEDYLFEGTTSGAASPITECLDAGWRVGLLGVTDEHGTNWGYPDGKGRTGLWVKSLTRAGVREAMEARRFFCTRIRGFRMDAALDGVRMGGTVGFQKGVAELTLDIDRGPEFYGKPLVVQVLQTGRPVPTIAFEQRITLPRPDQPVRRLRVPLDVENGRWAVVRITDPGAKADSRAPAAYRTAGNAIAYAAPFFLDPDRAPRTGPPRTQGSAPGPQAPSAGGSLPTTGAGVGVAAAATAAVVAAAVVRRSTTDRPTT